MKGLAPCVIEVAGERIALLAQRAALVVRTRTLLVADLHLGRQEAWRSQGMPISDRAATACLEEGLARLSHLVEAHAPERILVLGDLLHAPAGVTDEVVERFGVWRDRHPTPMELVPGNHDRRVGVVASRWRIAVREPIVREPPFSFVHDFEGLREPPADAVAFCGHVHPMVRLSMRGDSLRLPCFAVNARRVLLPAFSGMMSGCTLAPDPGDRHFAIADDRVIEVERGPRRAGLQTQSRGRAVL
jgi:DNA ligase-associated metallophosphoesterase